MTRPSLIHRSARSDDLHDLEVLMDAAITKLQKPFLSALGVEDGAGVQPCMAAISRPVATPPCSTGKGMQPASVPCTPIRGTLEGALAASPSPSARMPHARRGSGAWSSWPHDPANPSTVRVATRRWRVERTIEVALPCHSSGWASRSARGLTNLWSGPAMPGSRAQRRVHGGAFMTVALVGPETLASPSPSEAESGCNIPLDGLVMQSHETAPPEPSAGVVGCRQPCLAAEPPGRWAMLTTSLRVSGRAYMDCHPWGPHKSRRRGRGTL